MKTKGMEYFEALYEVARAINTSRKPEEVLKKIVVSVAEAMKVKACSLRLLDLRRKQLNLGAAWGLSKNYIKKGPILVAESGLDKQALKGKTVWIENVQTDKAFQYGDMAREEGIRSVLVVPLMVEKKAIGVLRVYTEKKRVFTDDETRFLHAAANLSAIALDHALHHESLRTRCDLMAEHKYRIDDN